MLHSASSRYKAIAVAGVTSWDSFWLQVLHAELIRYQDKVKEIDLVGNPSRQMLERISALSPHTVVMFQMVAILRSTGLRNLGSLERGRTTFSNLFRVAKILCEWLRWWSIQRPRTRMENDGRPGDAGALRRASR